MHVYACVCEGKGYIKLPTIPPIHSQRINCWNTVYLMKGESLTEADQSDSLTWKIGKEIEWCQSVFSLQLKWETHRPCLLFLLFKGKTGLLFVKRMESHISQHRRSFLISERFSGSWSWTLIKPGFLPPLDFLGHSVSCQYSKCFH